MHLPYNFLTSQVLCSLLCPSFSLSTVHHVHENPAFSSSYVELACNLAPVFKLFSRVFKVALSIPDSKMDNITLQVTSFHPFREMPIRTESSCMIVRRLLNEWAMNDAIRKKYMCKTIVTPRLICNAWCRYFTIYVVNLVL
jgi:hypothetical protein